MGDAGPLSEGLSGFAVTLQDAPGHLPLPLSFPSKSKAQSTLIRASNPAPGTVEAAKGEASLDLCGAGAVRSVTSCKAK